MIQPDAWQPADGITLEPNAVVAVREPSDNVVVTAGPGAGKTELLAQRASFLLATGGCPYPRRILAISFKVDAARNIRERVRRRSGERHAARFDSYTFHAFAKRIVDNYRVLLTGQDALDPDYTIDATQRIARQQITFNDLVPLAIQILQTSRYARNSVRQTYTHVFLDEFQDATNLQYELLKEAFLGSDAILTAVGDVKQRIMSWAGALDGIMRTFATDFSAKSLTLYQNFRSDPVLRRMQNRMIRVMDAVAAVPDEDLAGDQGAVEVLDCRSTNHEAAEIASRVEAWLNAGIPPSEIAILVRQQPHLVAGRLIDNLTARGIASRNEQTRQDLVSEPIAALILDLIRVLVDEGRSAEYEELTRLANRSSLTEEMALRHTTAIGNALSSQRSQLAKNPTSRADIQVWEKVIIGFLKLITRPGLTALSPEYQNGNRLDELISATVDAFKEELDKDGDPVAAARRLSEEDSVRILTIHKCKGLEFQKVVVLGVESQLFWGDSTASRSEFFVAISRAKNELVLTWSRQRPRPAGAPSRWEVDRQPLQEFLNYANE